MNYKKLFELSIFHDYYSNQLCPDFILQPTDECFKILKGHGLILKNKINGIIIVSPVNPRNENVPYTYINDNIQFTFLLIVKNPEFFEFTVNRSKGNIFFSKEKDVSISLCFTNQNNINKGNVRLQRKIAFLYYKKSLFIQNTRKETIKLSYNELPREKTVLGVSVINNNCSIFSDLRENADYQIRFHAKRRKWRYYLLLNPANQSSIIDDQFRIIDTQKEIQFNTFREVETGDPMFESLEAKYPSAIKYYSESHSRIICQELVTKDIWLIKKDNSGDEILIKHLPSPRNNSIIKVNKILNKEIIDKEIIDKEIIQYQLINLLKD
jgi:hypothetical protein